MALVVSSPAETVVFRVAVSDPATPDPPSEAEQAMLTSTGCQDPSAAPQLTAGALRSTWLPEMSAGEAAQLPAVSQALSVPAEAAALPFSDPLPTAVDRDTTWVAGPDPPSV